MGMVESPTRQGEATSDRVSNGKKPPHKCYGCEKEYTRPHKRLQHMRDCCPDELVGCPTCGVGYTNQDGMEVHHARQHDESLADTVEIYCDYCGEFYKEVYAYEADNYSTCDDCRNKAKSERMSGENNPMYKPDKPELTCKQCGDTFKVQPRNTDRQFCDYKCRDKYQRGENHPVWNGGKEHYYGPHWPEVRKKCLERDNYRCQGCGKHDKDASIALNAHHIKPRKTFDDPKDGDTVDNLVSLCLTCHHKWEGLPVKPVLLEP